MKKGFLIPVLTIVLAAGLLLGLSFGLKEVAGANARKEHLEIMDVLLPGEEGFVVEPYSGDDANIRSVHRRDTGYVIETVTAGYAGDITMLVAVNKDGMVVGLVVREMGETYSLGLNALNDADFLAQFLKTKGDAEIGAGVDAISGATVTSRAIARCVNSAVAYVTGADIDTGATSWGG
ncbi:MAG: FMN-binding protein [Lachnospiraceae bacterium]|jgi:electron transport complex protein RnfG|nr:FMN-binding protein [Lachnospiraceae bacterium]